MYTTGWHWQEKDCLPWSKHRLETLLEGLAIVEGESCMWIKIGKVESVTGEAYINTRKVTQDHALGVT
jgi:activator of HSP90 ATPase